LERRCWSMARYKEVWRSEDVTSRMYEAQTFNHAQSKSEP
jgi:hypothetical protein